MNKYFFVFFFVFFFFSENNVKAINLMENSKIYNIVSSSDVVVYEYENSVDDGSYHSIGVYFIKDDRFKILKNNNGEDINSSVFFPSISDNGRYVTFTSRATNITDDENNYCYNVMENYYEYCSKIYVYDIYNEKSILVQNNDENLNGDCYVSKISGNGRYVVFESTATNNLNSGSIANCLFNGENICVNIFKYDVVSKSILLVSSDRENYGGNFNSISPSVSYDGRYITFQSSSSNIVNEKYNYDLCKNISDSGLKMCAYVYLYDSKYRKNTIITSAEDDLFNDNSGNAIISADGTVVAYETYATNMFDIDNNRLQVVYYNIALKSNYIVGKDKKMNNRDTYLKSLSNDGKYILFETSSTNLNNEGLNSLYVYGVDSNSVSLFRNMQNSKIFIELDNHNVYFFQNFDIKIEKLDSQPPIIEKNQILYVIKDTNVDLKEKIIFSDNLSSKELIQIFSKNNLIFNIVGKFEVEIFCVDEFENTSSEFVTIVVVEKDDESPVFLGEKEIKLLKGSETLNLSAFIQAEDKIDGFTRIYIVDDDGLDLNKSGKYKLVLMTRDNSNNISYEEVYVIVYENYNFKFYYEIIFVVTIFLVAIFSIIKVKH